MHAAVLVQGDLGAAVIHILGTILMYFQVFSQELLVVHKLGIYICQIVQSHGNSVLATVGGADTVAGLGSLTGPADVALVHHQNVQIGVVLLDADGGDQARHTAAQHQDIRSIDFTVIFYCCHTQLPPFASSGIPVL